MQSRLDGRWVGLGDAAARAMRHLVHVIPRAAAGCAKSQSPRASKEPRAAAGCAKSQSPRASKDPRR